MTGDNKALSIISKCFLTMSIILLGIICIYLGLYQSGKILYLFSGFKVSMPLVTKIIIFCFPFVCAYLIWILIRKEKSENKIMTLAVNLLTTFIILPILVGV